MDELESSGSDTKTEYDEFDTWGNEDSFWSDEDTQQDTQQDTRQQQDIQEQQNKNIRPPTTPEELHEFIGKMHEYADSPLPGNNVPCSDVLLLKTTPYIALVFGKVWLFSRAIDSNSGMKRGFCFASIPTIARQLGLSKNTVVDALNTLCGKPYIGSGKAKRKNIYFDETNRLLIDVTPKEYKSKWQVRHYGILYKNFEKYIAKWMPQKNRDDDLSEKEILDIYEMIYGAF